MKFLYFYSLLFVICSCSEIVQDLEIESLINAYLRHYGKCEPLQFVDLMESFAQCPTKAVSKEQPGKNQKPHIWLQDLTASLLKNAAKVSESAQQISNGLYASLGNNECERQMPNAAYLQETAQHWGCYVRQNVANLKETAMPYAANFASLVKDASKGLANSVLRNDCERPPSSAANDVIARFQTLGCNFRQTLKDSWEATKPWAESVWLYSQDMGQLVKEKVEENRIYTYFFGEKKKLTWQEKLTASMKAYWQNFMS